MKTRIILTLLLLYIGISGSSVLAHPTATPKDSIRLSLLTCGPGQEIYTLFGHTAIRYEQPSRGIDVVFNYGVFDFNTPNFALRFALGQTDYLLAATPTRYFLSEYQYSEREVWQQTLNLTAAEKQRLVDSLLHNYRPENRMYRYNFFYDNCATRPRDRIEQAVQGSICYADSMNTPTRQSYRDVVHHYTEGHPWSRLGMDFAIGSASDRPITRRQMMFAPLHLMQYMAHATVTDSLGRSRPLVSHTSQLVKVPHPGGQQGRDEDSSLPSPQLLAWLLMVLAGIATILSWLKGRTLWALDIALFGAYGVAGCVLCFMVLFSQHPTISPNYLLLLFHPLHLLLLPWLICRERKHRLCPYHLLNLLILIFFITPLGIIPQNFNPVVLPLALCLLLRSASNVFAWRNKRIHINRK